MALDTDSTNTDGRHDGFEAMRLAFMLHRGSGSDPAEWPRGPDVLRMATENGARVLGIDTGVLHANGAAVERVFIAGGTACADGRVLAFDEEAVLAEAAALRHEVLDRASYRLPTVCAALPQLVAELHVYTGA